jgi:DAK2 domain fusion protein YloV
VRDAIETLDVAAVRRWCALALSGLLAAREEIDALNVYPVPDGDTGTNLYLTVEAAKEAVDELPPDADLAHTVRTLAHGALLGARGNSGVILSQLLRGLATTMARPTAVDATLLREALQRSADLGYAAVAKPVEGTMLTVARAAADSAERAGGDLRTVVRAAADGARVALARTPEQLEPLRRADVVDAGGRGLCVLYDALVGVVTGNLPVSVTRGAVPRPPQPMAASSGPAYEVMFLLDAADDDVPSLKHRLSGLGDSLVVVGGDRLWNVHVHVDDAGAAIEAGIAAGRPHRIRVTYLASAPGEAADRGAEGLAERGVVATVAGSGLAALFESAGASVVPGGSGRRPSTGELLAGIRTARAREVIVLPNDRESHAVAEAAAHQARKDGLRIAVIPTTATVQALAALAVHELGRRFDEDVMHMTAAASHTRHGGVTVAVKEAVTMAGLCQPGDVLGIVDGDFAVIGHDLREVACTVVDRLLDGGGELVTLVTGAEAPDNLADRVVEYIGSTRRGIDTVVYDGGQPRYPLLLGVE